MTAPSQLRKKALTTTSALLGAGLVVAGCSSGGGGEGEVSIDFLVTNVSHNMALGEALADAFMDENPDVSVSVDSRPGGGDGDNIVRTRLSTGEMADVFAYNTGSLFQALNPDEMLVDVSGESWVEDLEDNFADTVSTENGIYGASIGATFGGGIIYNRAVYEDLDLSVPETWDEFMDNNEVIAAEGITPVIQTYGDTHTAQLFVLGDFANVLAEDPEWADEYTANNRRYADEPAIQSFRYHEEVYDAGYFNENYPSAIVEDGARMLAEGEGAHYPMLSNVLSEVQQNTPDSVEDIGFFAIPTSDSANAHATMWQADGVYVPQSTDGDEREAALRFVEFINSDTGCELQSEHLAIAGPFPGTCELDDDVPPIITDLETYVDDGRSAPALEFLSPIKGPNLEHILVEVGSGIRSAEDAAAYYDDDVVNQARQLGLEDW